MSLAGPTSHLAHEVKTPPDLKKTIRTHFNVALLGFAIAAALYVVAAVLLLSPTGPAASFVAGLLPAQVSANTILLVSTAVALAAVLVWLIGRIRIVRNSAYQRASGCPSCHKQDLSRIRRLRSDRFAGKLIALPVERHACRSCNWQGLLVGSSGQFTTGQASKQRLRRKHTRSVTGRDALVASPTESAAKSPLPAGGSAIAAPAPTPSATVTQPSARQATPATTQPATDRTAPSSGTPAVAKQAQSLPVSRTSTQQPVTAETSVPEAAPAVNETPAESAAPPVAATAGAASTVEPAGERVPSSAAPVPARPLPELRVVGQRGHTVAIPPLYVAPVEAAVSANPEYAAAASQESQGGKQQISSNGAKAQPGTGASAAAILPEGYSGPVAIAIAPHGLKLRAAPRTDAKALQTLPLHTVVLLKGKGDAGETIAWREVTVGDMTGWVSSAFLRRLPDHHS